MELPEYSIGEVQDGFAKGTWTAAEVCSAFLERIRDINQAGPTLRAVIEVNPDALAIAEALDRERGEPGPRGALHDVPVLVKDSIDTADSKMTTAGSLAFVGNVASNDAFVVRRLRAAGAVILGKANMTELSYMRSTRTCSGWSSRGGQVRNPYPGPPPAHVPADVSDLRSLEPRAHPLTRSEHPPSVGELIGFVEAGRPGNNRCSQKTGGTAR